MGRGRKSNTKPETERGKIEEFLRKETDDVGFQQLTELLNLGSKEDLEAKMLETAKYQQGLKNLKDADQKLAEAKALVAERNSHHKLDAKVTEKRLRLIGLVISERFGDKIMDLKPSGE